MVTDNRIDLQALPKEAWRPSEGASGRISNRVGERELSRIPVAVALPDPEKGSRGAFLPAQLWDFSLHGFAVLVDKTQQPKDVNLVGYQSPSPKGEDRGYAFTTMDLKAHHSEDQKGDVYAIVVESMQANGQALADGLDHYEKP